MYKQYLVAAFWPSVTPRIKGNCLGNSLRIKGLSMFCSAQQENQTKQTLKQINIQILHLRYSHFYGYEWGWEKPSRCNPSQGACYCVEAPERVHWAAFTGEDSDLGGSHGPTPGQRHHQGQNAHSFLISSGYFIKDPHTALRHKELLWCSIYKIVNNLILFTSKKNNDLEEEK